MKSTNFDRLQDSAHRVNSGRQGKRTACAPRMLLAVALMGGCAIRAGTLEPSGAPGSAGSPEAAPAAAAPDFPMSGGTSLAQAEPISRGSTIEGVVWKEQPRYYRIQLGQGEELKMIWYTQIISSSGSGAGLNPVLAVLDEMGGKLMESMEATYATTAQNRFDRAEINYFASRTGPVFIQIDCTKCYEARIHYKLVVE